ncbi:hypothetical protein WN51_13387 [Melipona quadrifasciata]|uniref:Uncharacterized protein n=1 Tax=Melipona quadrifasciata TaxID=166423 RepID=A0A0M9A0W3_9HYME|nr:hypothetical protein WN51_13387 [Melipona quadrifasciata]
MERYEEEGEDSDNETDPEQLLNEWLGELDSLTAVRLYTGEYNWEAGKVRTASEFERIVIEGISSMTGRKKTRKRKTKEIEVHRYWAYLSPAFTLYKKKRSSSGDEEEEEEEKEVKWPRARGKEEGTRWRVADKIAEDVTSSRGLYDLRENPIIGESAKSTPDIDSVYLGAAFFCISNNSIARMKVSKSVERYTPWATKTTKAIEIYDL